MTGRLKEIINRLSAIITFNLAAPMTDEDFIADIDAINLLCNTCDDLCLDRSELRGNMDRLYPELLRRALNRPYPQHLLPTQKHWEAISPKSPIPSTPPPNSKALGSDFSEIAPESNQEQSTISTP